jgi:ATP-binding cassette subfamily F protein 3
MLTITDISVRIAGRLLIEDSSAQIAPGARVGFIGRNGVGKSSLFRAIRGELPTESGTITLPPRWRIGSLAQEAPDGPESLIEVVLTADLERAALLREADSARDPHRIAEIQTRLVDIDAHSAPARAAAILSGLGFSSADQGRPCAEFSGGWRMRVALAATLFAAPDLLLLDEPTNYLDLEGTLWLEDHLAHYPRTVIVISHDRDLLDTSIEQILHLDRGKLTLYKGTYSSFEEQRAARELLDAKHARRQADAKGALAFTRGSDVYFGTGAYAPSTPFGSRLIGHDVVVHQHPDVVEVYYAGTLVETMPRCEYRDFLYDLYQHS